jgi:hypothetical protein
MVVDYEGRILAQADPGPGEKIVVATIDIEALRHERRRRVGHHPLAHLRSEAYPVYRQRFFPPGQLNGAENHTPELNSQAIAAVKKRLADEGRL